MIDEVYKATFDALDGLYCACCSSQITNFNILNKHTNDSVMGDVLAEWMTIRVGCPRRTGKTMAIKRLIELHDLKTIVVTPSLNMAKIYYPNLVFATPRTIHRHEEKPLECLIVDEAEFCNMKPIVEFCVPYVEASLKDAEKTFVLVLVGTVRLKQRKM